MPTNASAGLVTALKASLADVDALWCVTSVTETTRMATATGTIAAGDGAVTTSQRIETRVSLPSPAVRASTVSPSPLRFDYVQVKLGGVYSEAHLVVNGTTLRTTDAALDTTVMALASAYTAAQDTALTAALEAGPDAEPVGVMPAAMIGDLIASLADEAAGWTVRARTDLVLPSGRTVTVVLGTEEVTFAAVAASEPGLRVPAMVTYTATRTAAGALTDAAVIVNGTGLRAASPALHAAIMALADAWLADQQSDIAAAVS